jgi:hypothetical protein
MVEVPRRLHRRSSELSDGLQPTSDSRIEKNAAVTEYADYRSKGPTTLELHAELHPAYDHLIESHNEHFKLVRAICGINGPERTTPLFPCDFVILSVLNRSLDLVDGFLWSFNRWNVSTAAPAVRMQVDNVLRLSLLSRAGPGPVVDLLLSGDPLNKTRDPLAPPDKKFKLTDERLRLYARDRFPWLDLVYEKSSGWVHFSSVHIGVTLEVSEDRQLSGRFPSDINRYPFDFLEQVLWSMNEATSGVLDIAREFANAKSGALGNG